tara:strand:+ start:455 stop:703 length:249 start_codon:yes stop_codon:yes gene_type:complete
MSKIKILGIDYSDKKILQGDLTTAEALNDFNFKAPGQVIAPKELLNEQQKLIEQITLADLVDQGEENIIDWADLMSTNQPCY